MYGGDWKHWWFWAALPPVLLLYRYLDRWLTAYCVRYWKARGQEPPPRKNSLRNSADQLLVCTVLVLVTAVWLAIDRHYVLAGCFALAVFPLGWWALVQARNNVIG